MGKGAERSLLLKNTKMNEGEEVKVKWKR